MARTDNDTWDLASSVGATATLVAAARAVASKAPDPLIDDPFAEPLVRAVGVDFFTKLASGEIDPSDMNDDSLPGLSRFADGMAARTRFFDEFFLAATDAGIRQAVILASGLDARAYRLAWPAGTTVFEIDQPEVIEFKTRTLADLGAAPTADRRTIAIDLRFDWPTALLDAGFDPALPSAWIAEGLFGYLPPEAQNSLLDQITELSAPGSRVGVEGVPSHRQEDDAAVRERLESVSDRWRSAGFDLDFSQLVFRGERDDVAEHLRGNGWTPTVTPTNDLLAGYGLKPLEGDDQGFAEVAYVSAER
ncbi:MAG: class I SAM-dependent methyltransferase [Mycobacterium sp.]